MPPCFFYISCLRYPISQLLIRFLVRSVRAELFSGRSGRYGRWCTDVLSNWLLCLWSSYCSPPAVKSWEIMEGVNETETCPGGQSFIAAPEHWVPSQQSTAKGMKVTTIIACHLHYKTLQTAAGLMFPCKFCRTEVGQCWRRNIVKLIFSKTPKGRNSSTATAERRGTKRESSIK